MADGRDALPALDAEDLAWLDARAYARAPGAEARPRPRRGLVAAIVLAHVLLALVVRESMRPPEFASAPDEVVMYLDFVPEAPDAVADPALAIPEPVAAAPRVVKVPRATPIVRPRRDAAPMTATFVTEEPVAAPEPELRLFNPDGSVRLPDAVDAPAAQGWRAPVVEKSPLFERKRALPVRTTRFAKVWKPDSESLGQEIVRKYPIAAILLQGVSAPKCPARSIDPDCEAEPVPQRFDEIMPDGF